LFDLLFLDAENLMALPLVERKTRLAFLLAGAPDSLRYNDHQIGHGPEFTTHRDCFASLAMTTRASWRSPACFCSANPVRAKAR
jgi:hypothetical protein